MVKNIQTCVTTTQNRNRKISVVSDFRLWSQIDPGLNPEFTVNQNPSGFGASDTLIYKNWVVGSVLWRKWGYWAELGWGLCADQLHLVKGFC